jgi:hypothetical protein
MEEEINAGVLKVRRRASDRWLMPVALERPATKGTLQSDEELVMASGKPNVLLIIADDLGWFDVGGISPRNDGGRDSQH